MIGAYKTDWGVFLIALGWLALSIVLMIVLENSDPIVSALHPLTSAVLSDSGILSGWNRFPPFDSAAAKALTAVFILLVPVQIASFFALPPEVICPKAQAKGVAAYFTIMVILALAPLLTFAWGLSVNGPLKIFGAETSLGASATICVITLAFSYLVRMIPILLGIGHSTGDGGQP